MTLAADIEAIGDELVAAFHERRLAASLDYLLLRLESAAIRAAALEAGRSADVTTGNCRVSHPSGGVVVDFLSRKEIVQ